MWDVTVRTQIVQPPVDTRVLLGHTATLQCKVSSDPTVPYQLDWFHNKQYVHLYYFAKLFNGLHVVLFGNSTNFILRQACWSILPHP